MNLSLLAFSFNLTFVCMLGYGQDTLKTLPEVEVSAFEINRIKTLDLTSQTYSKEQILLNQPEDIGAVIQKFSGTSMRNYGGLGGMKTVSVRGVGSQHSTFLIDGFSLVNTQTGQINLGQIQTDNVESISLSVGGKNGFLLPASSYINGSVISINTFENNFSIETFKLKYSSRIGSFGEIDNYLSMKYSKSNLFISVFGKYRQAKGNYDYTLQNGNILYQGVRGNNDLVDWYSGATAGFKLKNEAKIKINYKTNGANQGLPGSVVLYNTTANQRLSTESHSLNLDLSHQCKSIYYRLFGTLNHDWLHYTDPFFLNNSGGISSVYTNNSYQMGLSFQQLIRNNVSLYGGIESRYSDLKFSSINSALPKRIHSFGLIGLNLQREKWKTEIQLSSQQIMEENNMGERAENRFKINPFLSFEKIEFGKWKWKFKAWYRNSFRMPSFNELYYNNIGNVKLKPEEAHQFSIGFSTTPLNTEMKVNFLVNVFANRIQNQILAIPTKNLFVWSMQNIGFVNTFGYESRLEINKLIGKNWYSEATFNYTYQYSVDVSDSKSPTYLNQVAYVPKHTGNIDFTLKRKDIGIHLSTTISSLRYSLTENIIANQINGFTLLDASFFTKIKLAKKQSFRIQFSVKNIFNTSYSYMRYFVMPGRNYLITLNYAIN